MQLWNFIFKTCCRLTFKSISKFRLIFCVLWCRNVSDTTSRESLKDVLGLRIFFFFFFAGNAASGSFFLHIYVVIQ